MAAHRRLDRHRIYLCTGVLRKSAFLAFGSESQKQNVSRVRTIPVNHSMMSDAPRSVAIWVVVVCFASVALADDFKTIQGKEYKNATVSRVEADGIVIKTKAGISKIYFVELPKDVQERFHYGSATPIGKTVTQRVDEAESTNPATPFVSGADRFASFVEKKLDERESILQGKHTPGPAELMVMREINFHKAFLAGLAIVAIVLFAIVWARVK